MLRQGVTGVLYYPPVVGTLSQFHHQELATHGTNPLPVDPIPRNVATARTTATASIIKWRGPRPMRFA